MLPTPLSGNTTQLSFVPCQFDLIFFFFLIGINDSLSKDTQCFPWAVGFYFEIAAGLIFASLHLQAHLSPLEFLRLVLAPMQWGLLGS